MAMENLIASLAILGLTLFTPAQAMTSGDFLAGASQIVQQEKVLAQKTMDLSIRYPDPWVNEIFSDNILLNLHYLKGDVALLKDEKGKIDWEKVRAPFEFSFVLESGWTFAYHQNLTPEFKDKNVLAGQTRFWFDEGYKSDGYLVGDGVCHLASLFNWVSQEAGLEVVANVRHDFLPVPDIPREYGTSILYSPDGARGSANQNLYITNNFPQPVEFAISADEKTVKIQVVAEN